MILLLQSLFALEKDFHFERDRQEAGLKQLLKNTGSVILIAELNDQVIGMCSGQTVISTAEGGPALLVEDVIVTAAHQGKGVGGKLLQQLADWARQQSISRLQLLADRTNSEALGFYERQGWQTTQLICLRTYI